MGLWHGAQWTYVAWGVLNAVYFIPTIFSKGENSQIEDTNKLLPSLKELGGMLTVFLAIAISLVFFRANDMQHAISYFGMLFSESLFSIPQLAPTEIVVLMIGMLLIEWLQKDKRHALQFNNEKHPALLRWSCYIVLAFLINWYGYIPQDFIYFQF
jgi:D-alanyl-lipoteichoic acid acyltransferase DltB (MBOAT superfamily)